MVLSSHEAREGREKCVLLFSGGRDSSLAALRLCQDSDVTLVTVTSEHLTGLHAVRRRLDELGRTAPSAFSWICAPMPDRPVRIRGGDATCLPCQLAYVLVGVQVATAVGARTVALGYTGYQASWPEQTPYAKTRLRSVLQRLGIALLLPVEDVRSKAEASELLTRAGLSPEALEQKCSRQATNETLSESDSTAAIDSWVEQVSRLVPLVRQQPFRAIAQQLVISGETDV